MKVAICISGQPRNFKKSYESLKLNYLDKYDCDIYIHSWATPTFESTNFGYGNYSYLMEEKDYSELISLYQPKATMLEEPIVFDASGYKCPIWRQPLNNTLSMFYSIYKSINQVKHSYDFVIRTRFDIDYSKFVLKFPKDGIAIPKWNTDPRVSHRGYYDVFAVGTQPSMQVYSEVFSNIISYVTNDAKMLEFLQGEWPGQDSPLRNEYLLKWHLLQNKIPVVEIATLENKADVGLIR